MSHTALPDGCTHLEWRSDDDGQLLTWFATWTCPPGGEPDELPTRMAELAAQHLVVVGDPHLCQVDPVSGRELWAVLVAPELT